MEENFMIGKKASLFEPIQKCTQYFSYTREPRPMDVFIIYYLLSVKMHFLMQHSLSLKLFNFIPNWEERCLFLNLSFKENKSRG